MINFINISNSIPYKKFNIFYNKAREAGQLNIEAICISSYNLDQNEVESRYVNLKYIKENKWIFFSNFNSKKASDFEVHDQISALFFWPTTNLQIRLKAKISKIDDNFSDYHYQRRTLEKNALAHSSNQSSVIKSYEEVIKNYDNALKNSKKIMQRPTNWGGYYFIPYYFEFWEGNESRINKREIYEACGSEWNKYYLQP